MQHLKSIRDPMWPKLDSASKTRLHASESAVVMLTICKLFTAISQLHRISIKAQTGMENCNTQWGRRWLLGEVQRQTSWYHTLWKDLPLTWPLFNGWMFSWSNQPPCYNGARLKPQNMIFIMSVNSRPPTPCPPRAEVVEKRKGRKI